MSENAVRVGLCVGVSLGLWGCGVQVDGGTAGGSADGASSSAVREACPMVPDAEIEALRTLYEVARQDGLSFRDAHDEMFIGCQANDSIGPFACIVCGTAILNEVYGR